MTEPNANIPKEKQTVLGLYVTAKEAYEKWAAEPEQVKIIDGMEGDAVKDSDSVVLGQRLKNGWKNSGCPWTYKLTPERTVLPKPQA